jgi:hypothetical protein
MRRIGRATKGVGLVLLLVLLLVLACGENDPPAYDLLDAGADWAPWPPDPGDAGFELIWTIDGQPPTEPNCAELDLDRVRLSLVHPVADFETWTAPDLVADCAIGSILRPVDHGVAPGRYRFKVELLHGDGDPFQHDPWGEVVLVSGQVTPLAAVNVTEATPFDVGQ